MKHPPSSVLRPTFLLLFLIISAANDRLFPLAEAGKRRVHITDDLDDVIDNEEDDDWKNWGAKKSPDPDFNPPDFDFSQADFTEIQSEMIKHQTGPAFGFVKLRLGDSRKPVKI